MVEYLGAIGLVLLGLVGATLWVASRRSERVWRRNVAAFSSIVSPAFARGFAGGALLVNLGLVLGGVGHLVSLFGEATYGAGSHDPGYEVCVRTAFALVLSVPVLAVAGLAVSWLGRPEWMFPRHARHAAPPWRELRDARP
jgi:hypothetical protein